MRYIDRRFLLPVAAATAWAQQQTPEAAAAEASLRARVEQFFQLQVDKKFRQAESLVAEDSKDVYYNANKFNIKGFAIDRVELLDGNSRARVTIKAKVTLMLPAGGPVDLDAPSTTLWKLDKGEWTYYVDQATVVDTPFGKIDTKQVAQSPSPLNKNGKAPDLATLRNQVRVDRSSIVLTSQQPRQTVTVSNMLPGDVELTVSGERAQGFAVRMDRTYLKAGESAGIEFEAINEKPEQKVVKILVSPLNVELAIQVTKE